MRSRRTHGGTLSAASLSTTARGVTSHGRILTGRRAAVSFAAWRGCGRCRKCELAELLEVSQRTVSRWIHDGVPPAHAQRVDELAAISEVLETHVKADRLPAVVRRDAAALGGESIFSLIAANRGAEALRLTTLMFSFAEAHS